MDTTTIADIHMRTTRMSVEEVARHLNANLGPTLVALLAGVASKSQPIRWAKGEVDPRHDAVRRLQLAHRAWSHIVMVSDEHTARAWFIGGNPFLGEDTPLTAIREDRSQDVMRAVEALAEGRPAVGVDERGAATSADRHAQAAGGVL